MVKMPRPQNAHHIQPGEPVHEPVACCSPNLVAQEIYCYAKPPHTRSKSDASGSWLRADSAVVVSRLQLQQQEHVAIMQCHERTEQSRKQMQNTRVARLWEDDLPA